MIDEWLAGLLRVTGLPWLIRATLARSGVAILLYHDPEPAAFDGHLAYLNRHYRLIPFGTLVEALETGNWSHIPTRSVVIHLDDGNRRNFELLEICRRHGVRPTLYLCSHIAATRRRIWSTLRGGRAKQVRLLDNRALLAKAWRGGGFHARREYPEHQTLTLEDPVDVGPGRFPVARTLPLQRLHARRRDARGRSAQIARPDRAAERISL